MADENAKLSAPAGMPDRPRRFCADTVGNMHIDAHGGYVSVDDYETLCAFAQARAEAKLSAPAGGMPDAPIQSVVDTLLHQVRNRLDFDRSVLINVLQDIAPLRAFAQARAEECERLNGVVVTIHDERAREIARAEAAELLAATAQKERDELKARLTSMFPLFEEARDALTAIPLASAKLHNVRLDLAVRMDNVGDPKKWAEKK